ncbi:MAG: AI-2E family transporter, partial [Planctomycetaceae bacterium]|nr:AI-2E family transporter [Planctomycetaceae bacterium]
WTPRKAALATFATALVAAIALVLYWFQLLWGLMLLAILLAAALKPLIAGLHARGLSNTLAILCVVATLGLVVLVAIGVGLPLALDQLAEVSRLLPQQYELLRQSLRDSPHEWLARLGELLPADLLASITVADVVDGSSALSIVMTAAGYMLRGIALTFAVLLLTVYWLLYEQRTQRSLILLAPAKRRQEWLDLWEQIDAKLGDFLRGQALLCVAIFIVSWLGFALIGLRGAFFLGLIAGVLELVPYVGPTLSATLAVVVAAIFGPHAVVSAIVVSIAIQQLENYVLVPRIVGSVVGVNPMVTLLAMATFGMLFGMLGVVLAIPLAAIAQLFLEHFVFSAEALEPAPIKGRERLSRLRYEVEELLKDIRVKTRQPSSDEPQPHEHELDEAIEGIAADLSRLLVPESANAAQPASQPGELSLL